MRNPVKKKKKKHKRAKYRWRKSRGRRGWCGSCSWCILGYQWALLFRKTARVNLISSAPMLKERRALLSLNSSTGENLGERTNDSFLFRMQVQKDCSVWSDSLWYLLLRKHNIYGGGSVHEHEHRREGVRQCRSKPKDPLSARWTRTASCPGGTI